MEGKCELVFNFKKIPHFLSITSNHPLYSLDLNAVKPELPQKYLKNSCTLKITLKLTKLPQSKVNTSKV